MRFLSFQSVTFVRSLSHFDDVFINDFGSTNYSSLVFPVYMMSDQIFFFIHFSFSACFGLHNIPFFFNPFKFISLLLCEMVLLFNISI